MAGHSKWHNIQHRKAKEDARKGKIFTKLIRELTIAARKGGGDPNANPRLRLAVDKASSQNMPKDTMERAIKRGAGDDANDNLQDMRYEGYGPNGAAIIIDCLTDNKNRTVGEVRHALTKCGGNLGTTGSVSYLFNQKGTIIFNNNRNEEKIFEIAIDAGADDVVTQEDQSIMITTQPETINAVKDALVQQGLQPDSVDISMIASNEIIIDDPEQAEKMLRLTEMLEDLDDVQNVYSNANIPDEILEKIT